MKVVYWFNELSKDSLLVAGGKGANLGEMTRAGFPIPPGFVISAQTYFDFIKRARIDDLIKEKTSALDVQDTRALQKASEEIKSAILAARVPNDIRAEIVKAYNKLCGTDYLPSMSEEVKVAVRSSATAEDLPSIAGEEPVFVTFGGEALFLEVKELWRRYKENPNAEIMIPSLEGNKVVWKKVQELYAHPVKAKLAKITTKTGREITITPDHSLVVLDTDTMRVKPAGLKDLKKETRVPVLKKLALPSVAMPSELCVAETLGCEVVEDEKSLRIKQGRRNIQKQFPTKIALNEEFAYFLGVFAAEGSTYGNNCVDFSCKSFEVALKIRGFLNSLGLKPNKDSKNVRVFSIPLVKLLHKLFGEPSNAKGKGCRARTKRVPNLVFNSSKEFIGAYLRGYFDGNGYFSNNNVSACSVSKSLRAGTSLLLAMLGIRSYLRGFDVVVPTSDLKKFAELVGCTEQKKKERIERAVADHEARKYRDQLETFPASKKIAEIISRESSKRLPEVVREVFACPACGDAMTKNGKSSSGKQRWLCGACRASVSEGVTPLKATTYVTHSDVDAEGCFAKGFAPWNKGVFTPQPHGCVALQKIAGKLGCEELNEMLSCDVIWDEIAKIEEVDYEGLVFDFVVPGSQNFLAGAGGIITHNTASFAGQQASFLNVQGSEELVKKVRECWASLFEARAIYYRNEQGFDHLRVGLSAVVQKMVNSEKSGVMFSCDPVTGDRNKIVIEAGFGLGEAIVSGQITPDRYVVDKKTLRLLDKQVARQETMIVYSASGGTEHIDVPEEIQENQKLSDEEIIKLARYGKAIEEHYKFPQDIEWAVEGRKIYIVQSRAVTTLKETKETQETTAAPVTEPVVETPSAFLTPQADSKRVLLQGFGASPGVASGVVRIIGSPTEINRVAKGDILVTEMTSPDFVPAMKRASAIITNSGGMTCHAAIVSRELGIPCIVGTKKATEVLKEGQEVTVDARHGVVYEGIAKIEEKPLEEAAVTSVAAAAPIVTGTRIYVNISEPELAEKIAAKNVDGVGLFRAEFLIAGFGVHPKKLIKEGRSEEFVGKLAEGMRKICAAFHPRPVIYRANDFKTNEYRNLEGGEEFEPKEENPMIGYRGCLRYIKDPDIFLLELKAIKKVREEFGLKNLWLMIPFVRTVEEFKKCRQFVEQAGLQQSKDFKLGIMCEVPSTVIMAEEFCEAGIDFMSIGSNDLTQLTLGIDRDSGIIAEGFDERDEAVMRSIRLVIERCHKHGVSVGICGQLPSVYSEAAEKLVDFGIDSISINPDVIDSTRKIVACAEQKLMLKQLRKLSLGKN